MNVTGLRNHGRRSTRGELGAGLGSLPPRDRTAGAEQDGDHVEGEFVDHAGAELPESVILRMTRAGSAGSTMP